MPGRIINGWGWGSGRDDNDKDKGQEPDDMSRRDAGAGEAEVEPEVDLSGPGGTENVQSSLDTVEVETEAFVGKEILALYSLPGGLITEAMIAPDAIKMIKLVELFKLAVPPTFDQDVELLSWGELVEAVVQWVDKSGAGGEPPQDGRGGGGRGRGGGRGFI